MAKRKFPTKPGKDYEVGFCKPPKEHQFGAAKANPSHSGAWKKTDTLRYKLQQVAKMSIEELGQVISDPQTGEFERQIAQTILELSSLEPQKRWQILEGLVNQDSGYPKQQIDTRELPKLTPILPKPKRRIRKNEHK